MTVVPPEDAPPFSDSCWPVDVSCVSDDWYGTVGTGEDKEPRYTPRQQEYAAALAGQTMRMLTGYRVGGCPITVRPCRRDCTWPTWQTYPVRGYQGSTPWLPVNLGGQWINIGCGHTGGCGCSGVSEVPLHGPASEVTQVRVDGVVLDPALYVLRPGGLLARLDGQPWPLCQNLDAPDTEPGTWSVTYRQGVPVDGQGALAAGMLAGQYVRACSGTDCDLPKTVTQIVRSGVSVTLAPGAFPDGRTGIREVDAYLERWNPRGLRGSPMTVWSPDLHRPRGTGL